MYAWGWDANRLTVLCIPPNPSALYGTQLSQNHSLQATKSHNKHQTSTTSTTSQHANKYQQHPSRLNRTNHTQRTARGTYIPMKMISSHSMFAQRLRRPHSNKRLPSPQRGKSHWVISPATIVKFPIDSVEERDDVSHATRIWKSLEKGLINGDTEKPAKDIGELNKERDLCGSFHG